MYLAPVDGETSSDTSSDSSDDAAAPSGDPGWAAGDYVASPTAFLAMRAGPGTKESRIAWLGKGDVVQIVDGPFYNGSSDWWPVSDDRLHDYLFRRRST